MHPYTRLQILTKTNGFCLADTSCVLSEMRENRNTENATAHKVLTISEFLALSLVTQPSIDVVTVSIDQLAKDKIHVIIARNESTSEDVEQAESLRLLFMEHFINSSSGERQFRAANFRQMLNWGGLRYERRLTVLDHPECTHQGPKSAARASKLLTIEKVMSEFSRIASDNKKIQEIKSMHT